MGILGSDMTVNAAVDRTSVQPGESVTVKVVVGGQPDAKVQAGRVELACINRYQEKEYQRDSDGDRTERTVTREDTTVPVWQPIPGGPDGPVAFGEHTVTLQFPPDATPTAHEPEAFGSMVRWEVRAILDRHMSLDPDASIEVQVHSLPGQYAHWAASPPVVKSPKVPMGLEQLSTRALRPGDQLTGVLHVNPTESAKGRTVRVQLERRRTDTPDNMEDVNTAMEVELARDVKIEAGQALQYPFQIPLPEGVPPTFQANKSHMHWYLEGIIDRKLRSDFVVEAEVVVFTGPGDPVAAQPAGVPAAAPAAPVGGSQPPVPPPAPANQAPSAQAQPGSFPPDWYPDPWLESRLRYWDGNAWTGHAAD
jgi:sporulation-control protein spo0M